MWQYIKGISIGLLLLWLLFFLCFILSDGFFMAISLIRTFTMGVLNIFQQLTKGTGIWIVLFIILSSWVWSFTRSKRVPAISTFVPKQDFPKHSEDPES